MIIVNNGQPVFVGWRYENPELDKMVANKGMTPQEAKEMTEPELLLVFNNISKEEAKGMKPQELADSMKIMKTLPKPTVTFCVMTDEKKNVLGGEWVKKHKNDLYDKDKARRYSLAKLLHKMYPGIENKKTRMIFWDAYLNRFKKEVVLVTA